LSNRLSTIGLKNSRNESDFINDIKALLEEETTSLEYGNPSGRYSYLFLNYFKISKIGYIERDIDENKIFGEAFEFSRKTIDNLREERYNDYKNIVFLSGGFR